MQSREAPHNQEGRPSEEMILAEKRLRDLLRRGETLESIENLHIRASHLKLQSLVPLAQCVRLRCLDASRNAIKSLEGADRLLGLQSLNLCANKVADIGELLRLRPLALLSEVDLRQNPVIKQESYRLFAIKYLPRLRKLDGSDITAVERSRADRLFANLDCDSSSSDDGDHECARLGGSDEASNGEQEHFHPASSVSFKSNHRVRLHNTGACQDRTSRGRRPEDKAGLDKLDELDPGAGELSKLRFMDSTQEQNADYGDVSWATKYDDTQTASSGNDAQRQHQDASFGEVIRAQTAVPGARADSSHELEALMQVPNTDKAKLARAAAAAAAEAAAAAAAPACEASRAYLSSSAHEALAASAHAQATHASALEARENGVAARRGQVAGEAEACGVAGEGGRYSSFGCIEDAMRREVEGLVMVQELRVKEMAARIAAANAEIEVLRARTREAEGAAAAAEARAAAAEAELAAVSSSAVASAASTAGANTRGNVARTTLGACEAAAGGARASRTSTAEVALALRGGYGLDVGARCEKELPASPLADGAACRAGSDDEARVQGGVGGSAGFERAGKWLASLGGGGIETLRAARAGEERERERELGREGERELVEMLRESHAMLVAECRHVRAELEAEREARRKDAQDFQVP
jgi:hypothetical protein